MKLRKIKEVTISRFHLKQLILFVGVVSLLTAFECIAAPTASLSGRVIDEAGNPVEGITGTLLTDVHELMIQRMLPWMFAEVVDRNVPPAAPDAPPYTQVVFKTDKTGAFALTNVVSQPIMMLGLKLHDYKINRFKIGGVTFQVDPNMNSVLFSISPGTTLQDIEITVRRQSGIPIQVVTTDGTPLKNAQVEIIIEQHLKDGLVTLTDTISLDDTGRFTARIFGDGTYTVSVTYKGQTAQSTPVKIERRLRADAVILKLLPEIEQHKLKEITNLANLEIQQLVDKGTWVINPENRHAYKRIAIKSLEQARQQAKAQDAYLVAINNETEQQWLLEILGGHSTMNNFWLGLKAEATHWDSGEPVSFTRLRTRTEGNDIEIDSNANVMLLGDEGVWIVQPSNATNGYAILEKENLIIGIPEPNDPTKNDKGKSK